MAAPARADDDQLQRLYNENRYLPLWLNAQGDANRAQYAAFIGDESMALANAASNGTPPTFSDDAHSIPAIEHIVTASKGQRIVMLNEAHVASRHRCFFAALLRALRNEGFTHIACEDFLNSNVPGEPSISDFRAHAPLPPVVGFYLRDPVYAEAIREAAELGYRFVRYDARSDQTVASETDTAAIARREEAEANNFIANALADPSARILIYVGYSHLRERPDNANNIWFAQRMAQKTGIDPLTVAQSYPGSFGPHAPDGATARMILQRFHPREPIVIDEGGGHIHGAYGADIVVYHPSLPDVRGRPGWLAADPMRRFARVSVRRPHQNLVLAQAIHAEDEEVAIPADQYLLPTGQSHADFLLRPGRYRIRLETLGGLTPVGELSVTP